GMLVEQAMEALPAGDDEWHHHPVADPDPLHLRAGRLHHAHELVAEDVATLHARDLAAVDVQVRAADGRGGDPQDDVVSGHQRRIGHRFNPHVAGAVIGECLHGVRLRRGGASPWPQCRQGKVSRRRWARLTPRCWTCRRYRYPSPKTDRRERACAHAGRANRAGPRVPRAALRGRCAPGWNACRAARPVQCPWAGWMETLEWSFACLLVGRAGWLRGCGVVVDTGACLWRCARLDGRT